MCGHAEFKESTKFPFCELFKIFIFYYFHIHQLLVLTIWKNGIDPPSYLKLSTWVHALLQHHIPFANACATWRLYYFGGPSLLRTSQGKLSATWSSLKNMHLLGTSSELKPFYRFHLSPHLTKEPAPATVKALTQTQRQEKFVLHYCGADEVSQNDSLCMDWLLYGEIFHECPNKLEDLFIAVMREKLGGMFPFDMPESKVRTFFHNYVFTKQHESSWKTCPESEHGETNRTS